MSSLDHYQLLGVKRSASRRTIRAAYRKALRRHHPDANAGRRDGEQLLLQVITAGRILSDQKQRLRYDHELEKSAQVNVPPDAPHKPTPLISSQKLRLLSATILQQGKSAWLKFFCKDQAAATEMRAAQKRQRGAPDFNFYLHQAMNRKSTSPYERGEDGVCRKAAQQPRHVTLREWRKRTAVWLLIGIMLLRD